MKELTFEQIQIVSGAKIFIHASENNSLYIQLLSSFDMLSYNNLIFTVNGCFLDGNEVDPTKSYNGYRVVTHDHNGYHGRFSLIPFNGV